MIFRSLVQLLLGHPSLEPAEESRTVSPRWRVWVWAGTGRRRTDSYLRPKASFRNALTPLQRSTRPLWVWHSRQCYFGKEVKADLKPSYSFQENDSTWSAKGKKVWVGMGFKPKPLQWRLTFPWRVSRQESIQKGLGSETWNWNWNTNWNVAEFTPQSLQLTLLLVGTDWVTGPIYTMNGSSGIIMMQLELAARNCPWSVKRNQN